MRPALEGMVVVRFTMTDGEWSGVVRDGTVGPDHAQMNAIRFAVFAVGAFAFFSAVRLAAQGSLTFGDIAFAVPGALLVAGADLGYRTHLLHVSQRLLGRLLLLPQVETDVSFSSQGIDYGTFCSTGHIDWNGIQVVRLMEPVLALEGIGGRVYVPTRAFSGDQLALVRALAHSKLR
jgi:hypothetical protein